MASALPENQARFTLGELARATGGTLVSSGPSEREVVGIGTDSRAALAGKLFVALKGERFDGHTFADGAAKAGAAAVLVENDAGPLSIPALRVRSTLAALGAIAALHRSRFTGRLVAVAGSAGKTTTRSAIGAVLELCAPGRVHQTSGNLNNLIGVPLVLLGLTPEQRYAVVELGTNAPGEVATLTAMSRPDAAVLTLIGLEHTEGLGDLDGIEREEGALFDGLSQGGIALGNADDTRVLALLERARARQKIRYGCAPGVEVRCVRRSAAGVGRQRVSIETRRGRLELELSLLGEAGAYAALAAVAVAGAVASEPLDPHAVSAALSASGEPGRLEVHELADGTVVLDDAYNANPASALSSLKTAREVASDRRARLVLVVGEMRELGALSAREHQSLGEAIARSGAAELIAVVGDAALYLDPAKNAGIRSVFAADADEALRLAKDRVRPGDVVLVKASRGVRAERVVRGLVERGAA
jgi:UDP-N-acetylmuramoyl-tripeptide--D-alanyl-D-alanine ligase